MKRFAELIFAFLINFCRLHTIVILRKLFLRIWAKITKINPAKISYAKIYYAKISLQIISLQIISLQIISLQIISLQIISLQIISLQIISSLDPFHANRFSRYVPERPEGFTATDQKTYMYTKLIYTEQPNDV